MRRVKLLLLAVVGIVFLSATSAAHAQDSPSFITIVNPVRARPMWSDLSLLKQQASFSQKRNLPATWLLQYNTLTDWDVIDLLKSYKAKGDEIGVFLEVSEELATEADTPYLLGNGDWARADKVFFSGYEVLERKRMIDELFYKFKDTFGEYPKSVGAWYIDPTTLGYIAKKYGAIAAIDCSDQYATDGYEKWGKPWGVPYYPSRWNILVPAQTLSNKLKVVKLQWALRDPEKGYGLGVPDSTYSLQANDYVGHHKLGIDYFKNLLGKYLITQNIFSHATIGLEVGSESQFLSEFDRQIEEVARRKEGGTQVVTMSQFASWYSKTFPTISPDHLISSDNAWWYSSPFYRIGLLLKDGNLILRDLRLYDETYLDDDLVRADRREELYRSVFGPVDDLLFGNAQTIANDVVSVEATRSGYVVISWQGKTPGTLELTSDKAILNTHPFISAKEPIGFGWYRTFWKKIALIAAYFARVPKPSYTLPPFRYAQIGNKRVFGLQVQKEKLFAISFPPFRIGISYFPFQNVVRFKTWPQLSLSKALFVSDDALYANWFLKGHPQANLTTLPRFAVTKETVEKLNANGLRRVFENNLVSIWQKIQ